MYAREKMKWHFIKYIVVKNNFNYFMKSKKNPNNILKLLNFNATIILLWKTTDMQISYHNSFEILLLKLLLETISALFPTKLSNYKHSNF